MTIEYVPQNWKDYELLDSGRGAKLERFGEYVLARPEPKALWDKSMSDAEWNRLGSLTHIFSDYFTREASSLFFLSN